MTSVQQQYADLIALTRNYLSEEFQGQQRLFTDQETYHYFRNYALSVQSQGKAAPVQQQQTIAPRAPIPQSSPKPIQQLPKSSIEPQRRPSPARTPLPLPEQPKTMAPPSQKETSSVADSSFKLESPPPPKTTHFVELKAIVKDKLPHFPYIETIPDDAIARRYANGWQIPKEAAEILLLHLEETQPQERSFLANISKTLTLYGFSVAMMNLAIEEQRSELIKAILSDKTKLVLASREVFDSLPSLRHYLRNDQQQLIGNTPILLLPPLKAYFDEPILKETLWSAISKVVR